MGVEGAAYATLLSSILMFIFYFLYLFNSEIINRYKVFIPTIDFNMMKRQFVIGYPQAISEILLNISCLISRIMLLPT